MRDLIYIPILHTQADMGTLAEPVRRITIKKLGRQAWERHVTAIDQMWRNIRRAIEGWNLPFPHVRVYQDGLPNCGREMELVRQSANAGSPNHQLLLDLVEKGATLMGTESASLLLEEYQLIRQTVSTGGGEEGMQGIQSKDGMQSKDGIQFHGQAEESLGNSSLLDRRDRHIAERINSTLRVGEVGLIFLGFLHSLEGRLATDIHVSYPLGRSAFARKGDARDGITKGPHR